LIKKPDELVAARLQPTSYWNWWRRVFCSSDASPFIEYTSNAVYLEDGEMAIIRLHKSNERNIKDDSLVDPYIQDFKWIWKRGLWSFYVERNLRAT
jgi:glucosamine--fructose-6-phosphate aminotransferase (isomerizing)